MIKFFKQMHQKNRVHFVICWFISYFIWIVVNKTCHYILPKWIDLLVGLPLSTYLVFIFAKFYLKKYFRHEE